MYALFGDDIRILIVPKNVDPFFYVLNILAMIAFIIEIVILSIAKEKYLNGFFFWLDVISTFSLLFDIGWFYEALFY